MPGAATLGAGSDAVVIAGGERIAALEAGDGRLRWSASIASLGGSIADTVRTRVYLRSADDWEPVSRVHGRVLGAVRPANTLIEVSRLVGEYLVEIEAEAVVG